jgi:kumamolisin
MNEAFGTTLQLCQNEHGTFRGRSGTLSLPLDVHDLVVGVFGLDSRAQAFTRSRRRLHLDTAPRAAGDTSYTPLDVARLYQFPTNVTGAGETVAIIELGGGYRAADLRAYFSGLGLATTPSVTAVSVDGAGNAPTGDPNSADGEVVLDVEVVGSIAPGATIAVYFAPNTDQGFLDAITTAVHDSVRNPSVISISWGGPESSWTQQSLQNYDQAFQDAAAMGVSVFCASGDSGSSDGVSDGSAQVDFPASTSSPAAAHGSKARKARYSARSSGTRERPAGPPVEASARCSRFPLIRKTRRSPFRSTLHTSRVEECPMSPATRTRRLAIRFRSMARTPYSAARALWLRCGPG